MSVANYEPVAHSTIQNTRRAALGGCFRRSCYTLFMFFRYGIRNFVTRAIRYTASGTSTYLFDLGIVFLLATYTSINLNAIIAFGFLVGMSINFFICYFWTFRGTEQTVPRGYTIFILLALLGTFMISYGTTFVMETFDLPLLIARIIVAFCLGCMGFVVNGILNFKVL